MCFLKVGGKNHKRLWAMNKPTNVIHSGWITKSPPEQKLQSPIKIFRAKWKQRFFVLHKPSRSLHDHYELSYYNSEQCSKKKGSIDLDQCEQIIESLDSDQYPYLLAIKTIYKGKIRTYYLATNTEEEMSSWVQCLCRVCGLKQEDTPTDIPGSRLSQYGVPNPTTVASTPPVHNNSTQSAAGPTITSQPASTPPSRATTVTTSSSSSSNSNPPPSSSAQSYVLLNECTTGSPEKHGDRYGRADSIDSVPEYQAPPPPLKKGSHVLNNNIEDFSKNDLHDSVFDVYDRPPNAGGLEGYGRPPTTGNQEVYDRPPTAGNQEVYDRPPNSGGQEVYDRPPNSGGQEVYDRPPTAGGQEVYNRPRSGFQDVYDRPRSGELRAASHDSLEDEGLYKVPPNAGGQGVLLNVTRSSMSSDTLDLNAAVPLPLPRRSPRSGRSSFSERPDSVDSLAESYDVPPPRPSASSQDEPPPPQRPPKPHKLMAQSPYQNLPSNSPGREESSLNTVPAAPPSFCNPAALSYDVPRSSTVAAPPRESSILDIAPPPRPAPLSKNAAGGEGHAYLNMAPVLPPLPESHLRGRHGEKRGVEPVQDDSSSPLPSPNSHGPTTNYANMGGGGRRDNQDLHQVPPVAPRNPARSSTLPAHRTADPGMSEMEAHYIWSNTRTKSFKRNNRVDLSSVPARPPPLEPRRPPLPMRNEFASSSDDDDDISVDGVDTRIDTRVLRMSTVPTPPEPDVEPELRYLELALETPPDPSRPQATASHSRSTDYREIDFVKTRALQDTRNFRHMNMEK